MVVRHYSVLPEIILHVFGNILKGEWRAWPNISDQNE